MNLFIILHEIILLKFNVSVAYHYIIKTQFLEKITNTEYRHFYRGPRDVQSCSITTMATFHTA